MTPEEQEAVRRALAATPPEGPMPAEVVARLEATIADLAAVRHVEPGPTSGTETGARAEPGTGAVVSDLEERRRRRWPRVLVAAASVAVLAYGVGAVLPDLGPQAETAMDSAGGQAAEDGDAEVGGSTAGGAGPEAAEPPPDQAAPELMRGGQVVLLREATLRRDVARHLSVEPAAALADGKADRVTAQRYTRRDGTCVVPEVRGGDELHAARLDGRRATLVVRAAEGGSRVAQVYWCGDGRTLLAETEVPARR